MTAPAPTPTKIALSRLQAAVAALSIATASATAAIKTTAPSPQPSSCITAVEVYYGNTNDTLLWVPPQGTALRDSLVKLDQNGKDVTSNFVLTPVQVCFSHPVPIRPVLKT